jgi:hypothetical protein
VIGGCFDEEFAEWSNALMADFRDQRFRLVVSDVTAAEVAMAPEPIRELFSELLAGADVLQITQEALELVSAYEEHGILRPRFRNDMLHIAIATVAEVDVVVRACLISLDCREKVGNRGRFRANPRRIAGLFTVIRTGETST